MPSKLKTYVALLRGINVGGKNVIPMAELRACFESAGMSSVRSYIQSGNVVFQSSISVNKKLVAKLENVLSSCFAYQARVVVVEKNEYSSMVESAHKTWGNRADQKHNAMFLVDQADASEFLADLPSPKENIDTVSTGTSVIFWSAKQDKITKSAMMQISKLKAYKQMTVRNHKTTLKLLELMSEL